MNHFESGDYVTFGDDDTVRGQVLWTENDGMYGVAYVCWETGFEPYSCVSLKDLKPINILDLLADGRKLNYEFIPPKGRCRCGTNLRTSRKKWRGQRLMICCKCRVYYKPDGTPHVHGDS